MEILFAVMLGLFLGALDQTIVGPALPTIVTQLNGNDLYTWAVTSYLLTSTISVPFWGKLSDIYGRKPIFMIGIVVFLIGSALSGLSQTMEQLIFFRGLQGIGAGSLFPVALSIIGDLFTPAERGRYQGLFGAVFGVAFVAGPLIGGYLTEHAGWHWIFYVNIPIGIVALAVIQRLLPTVKSSNATRNFDILGGVIFTIATTMFLIGLTFKGLTNDATHALYEWTDPQVGGLILAGLIGYVLFVLAEARAKEPIVPLDLWRSRAYSASMVSIFFAAFAFFGAIVFLPRWFQVVQGFSPTNSGLAALPLVIGLISSSIASGIMVARTGRYKLILVVAIATLGLATALMTQLTKDTPLPIVWFWMFLAGLGVGPTFSVFTIVIQNSVPFRQMGVATSNLTFFRQIGGSVALAFVGTIFATTFQNDFVPQLTQAGVSQGTMAQIEGALKSGLFDLSNVVGVGNLHDAIAKFAPPADVEAIVQGIYGAFSLAVAQTFYLGVFGALVALIAALAIKELPAPRQQLGSGVGRGPGREACPQPRVTRRPASELRGPAALRVAGPLHARLSRAAPRDWRHDAARISQQAAARVAESQGLPGWRPRDSPSSIQGLPASRGSAMRPP